MPDDRITRNASVGDEKVDCREKPQHFLLALCPFPSAAASVVSAIHSVCIHVLFSDCNQHEVAL
jgi:hypothetical protein